MDKINKQIVLFKVFMSEDVVKPLGDVLLSGYIGQGEKVEQFEELLKNHLGNLLCLTTNAATSAIHIALHLLKKQGSINRTSVEDGDEVLATPLTCTATNWPILANRLRIKWVDVDPSTCNMDLDDLARKISSKTKIILPVHWGGYPNDLDKIKDIQEVAYNKFGFKPLVIEDCAHSWGSKYKNKYLGNHGNIAIYSFQAIKHFTTGDGGLLVLPERSLYERAKLLRWYGIDRNTNAKDFRCEDDIPEWGYKMHMNDINATIGIHNYPHILKSVVLKHQENAEFYNTVLAETPGVELMRRENDRSSAYWIYTMKVERRDDFMRYMRECNIMVSRVHERNDKHSCVSEFQSILPSLDKLANEMICIPNGWWVGSEEREYVAECIKRGW